MHLKEKLLNQSAERRIALIKEKGFPVDAQIERYLIAKVNVLSRLFDYYSLRHPPDHQNVFLVDETIVTLTLYIDDQLVYSYDACTDVVVDNIDNTVMNIPHFYLQEVWVNDKLFALTSKQAILLYYFTQDNTALFNDLAKIDGWVRLAGTG